ncbi:sensor histidine kinase [Microbulbifer sp. THAF38]|uniref:sensor histidine kinase n=1 Tax=Microbulbifer sp. THAF38 TaxID=2587856 RepID=UPI0012678934|nr:histidine kinase [Microbulbifer sp. THAF38]QFT54476.1 Sensor histidine kinase YpdA [Microbulbifer sp. THAF38]
MNFLKSPTPSVKFLSYHFGGWAIFSLVNTFSLGLLTQDHIDKIAIHVATVVLTVGFSTLIIREITYRFNLFDKSWYQQWAYFLSASIILGFICACIAVSIIYAYYNSEGYTVVHTFWEAVFDSWLILILLMLTWSLIYLTAVNQDRLRRAEQDATQLKLQLNEAKMSALMGQLNPHFLFNGLNNIRALILEDTNKSREMLTNLSDLLRYTLIAHKHKTVPLRDELEIVCQYIELLKIQYEDRLAFKIEVEDHLMGERIPPLLIQLLAENAVRHGIEKCKQGGELMIKVTKEENHIVIIVKNPGTLNTTSTTESNNTGLGLSNIQKRLTIQYGSRTRFNIKQQGSQVVAQCHIPSSLQLVV